MLVALVSLIAQTSAPCTPLCAAMIIHFQNEGCFRNLGATTARRSVEDKTSSRSSKYNCLRATGFPCDVQVPRTDFTLIAVDRIGVRLLGQELFGDVKQ